MPGINMLIMNDVVTLDHGSGGRRTKVLIDELFASIFRMKQPLTDSAVNKCTGSYYAFTTDSYVVTPPFFAGGNTGNIAVCGTINDLAVSGAKPMVLSAAFIIEEGFAMTSLEKIVRSMASDADKAGVQIVTGDTKVVEKGKCDGIFITTSGVGFIEERLKGISTASGVIPGDKIIINGNLGNHALAVLAARGELSFSTSIRSDVAPLNKLITNITDKINGVRFMRDATRGGLAGVLNELASMAGFALSIDESSVPVAEEARGLCEVLGFDPLYLANEGKVVMVVSADEAEKTVSLMKNEEYGETATIIGEVSSQGKAIVNMLTVPGGSRIIDVPSGNQIPRIC